MTRHATVSLEAPCAVNRQILDEYHVRKLGPKYSSLLATLTTAQVRDLSYFFCLPGLLRYSSSSFPFPELPIFVSTFDRLRGYAMITLGDGQSVSKGWHCIQPQNFQSE